MFYRPQNSSSTRKDDDPRRKHFLVRMMQDQRPYSPITKEELDEWEQQGFFGGNQEQGATREPDQPREHPEIRRETGEGEASKEPYPVKGGNMFIPGNKEFPDVGDEEVLPRNDAEWRRMKGLL